MKRKAEPASLEEEEEDPRTGDILRKAAASASITSSSDQFERRRIWRKSDLNFQNNAASKSFGSLMEIFAQAKAGEILTILAGEHEDNLEVWQDCEKSGRRYRVFYHVDNVINGEPRTYVEREILISKEGGDLDRVDQEIIVAQRTYSTRGNIELKAHMLCFKGRLDLDRPYVFPGLGDEIPGVGCPDLHCTFRGIRDWHTVAGLAKFANCDYTVSIKVTTADIRSGRKIVFDFDRGRVITPNEKSKFGVQVSCGDFKPLYETVTTTAKDASKAYPSPPSKRQKVSGSTPVANTNQDGKSMAIGMKLIGMGPVVEGTLRADLNINIVLKD